MIQKKDIQKKFLEKYECNKDHYQSALEELKERLKLRLSQLASQKGTRAKVTDARVKRPAKIWKKATKAGLSLDEAFTKIEDILGIRIVCNNLSDVDEIIEMIRIEGGLLKITEIKDMISEPTQAGYRATHVCTKTWDLFTPGRISIPCEIQIRSMAQDLWATLSHRDIYKNTDLPPELETEMISLSELLKKVDKTSLDIMKIIEDAKQKDQLPTITLVQYSGYIPSGATSYAPSSATTFIGPLYGDEE